MCPVIAFASGASDDTAAYRLGPEDLIEIEVFEVEELKKTVRVSASGFITLPLIGELKAEGMTEIELEEEIAEVLKTRYMHNPQVSVFVKEGGYFYVLGKVENKDGRYPFRPRLTLQQAIAMAGGFAASEAALRWIKITRLTEDGTETFTVDYPEIVLGRLKDMPIKKNDIIFVEDLGRFYVGGYVRGPGGFELRMDTTVGQAIATAGDISEEGDPSDVQVKRSNGDGKTEIISVNYNRIKKGEAEDVRIMKDDVIYVPRSFVRSLVRAFFFSIGIGSSSSMGVNPTTFVQR
ncbi:MAG: polysaccharide biosynthesis/export family protein [Deltaproteobacteria bacterium]|nr:polysaccharide biosynthesis/export family protein [Deltaproteobacteria bacterium]